MHILIAPNAFKNSLTAMEAATCIESGLQSSKLKFTSDLFPIADGGDGTGSLIIRQFEGAIIKTEVHDPLGRKIGSTFGLIENGQTAVIEMAEASGLRLLHRTELNPLKTSTFGTGELIRHALDQGVSKILIALGGSATVDGGAGLLQALGVRFFNAGNEVLQATPENLAEMASIDVSGLDQRIFNCEIVVLCDVDNKLTGSEGAAAIFGPQKGASQEDVIKLDSLLLKIADLALKLTSRNMNEVEHGGAAGGVAGALYAFLNARLVKGAEYFLEFTSFEEMLHKADLVITGEGSIDEQTLSGKGPFVVASMAKSKDIFVIGLAGKVPIIPVDKFRDYFDVLLPIGNEPTDISAAIINTDSNLRRMSAEVGNLLSLTI